MSDKVARNALSRYADVYVCDRCGVHEALMAYSGKPECLETWTIALYPDKFGIAENDDKREHS